MKKFALAAAAALALGGSAWAEESEISANVSVDYASEYIWRGGVVVDDPVIQPSLTLGFGGFSANVWGNYDLTDNGRENNFSEVDYTLSYGLEFDSVSAELGYIYYDFPSLGSGDDDAQEVYLSLGFDVILAPSITVYYDVDDIEAFHVELGIGHSIEIDDKMTLDLSASIGWGEEDYNAAYYGDTVADPASDEFTNYYLGATLSYAMSEKLSASWTLAYTGVVGDAADSVEAGTSAYGAADDDNVLFVVGFSYDF